MKRAHFNGRILDELKRDGKADTRTYRYMMTRSRREMEGALNG